MNITKETIIYLILAAILTTVVGHFVKRELQKRYPTTED